LPPYCEGEQGAHILDLDTTNWGDESGLSLNTELSWTCTKRKTPNPWQKLDPGHPPCRQLFYWL